MERAVQAKWGPDSLPAFRHRGGLTKMYKMLTSVESAANPMQNNKTNRQPNSHTIAPLIAMA